MEPGKGSVTLIAKQIAMPSVIYLSDSNKKSYCSFLQVMYMYYLLTFKLSCTAEELQETTPRYANSDTEELQQKLAENTFLLALDGDVDFEPQSVITLVHKMQIDPDTAAVCGRIHPKGFGETYTPFVSALY